MVFRTISSLVLACLLVCGGAPAQEAPAAGETPTPPTPSLQALYDNAKALAGSPEEMERAIAAYRSMIEAHAANERLYRSAILEVADCYEKSGQVEEGIRFFIGLARDQGMGQRQEVLKEVFARFQLKHRALVERIASEGRPPSGKASSPPVPAKDLVDAIVQREDPDLREKALERLRGMFSPEASPDQAKTALASLHSSMTAKFDRAPFRPLVIPLLQSEDPQVRALALRCLPGLEATEKDLAHIVPLAKDPAPEVRKCAGGALIAVGKGEQADQVIPALTALLTDADPKVVERTLRSMWGQYSSPEFDELLIALSRDPQQHHHAIYHALSTMRTKSVPVCRRLLEELAEPDWNNSGRAAWGLTYGVTGEAASLVEEGLLKALPEETNEYTRREEFEALSKVATEKSRAYLTSVAESEMETEKFKGMAGDILARLDAKR